MPEVREGPVNDICGAAEAKAQAGVSFREHVASIQRTIWTEAAIRRRTMTLFVIAAGLMTVIHMVAGGSARAGP